MGDILEQATIFLRVVWQRRWLALSCAILICFVGWIAVALLPSKYQSTAVLYIERTSLLQPLLKDLAAKSTAPEEIATIMQHTLLVRPNLEKLARAAGIRKTRVTSTAYELAMKKIRGSITVSLTPEYRGGFKILYQHTNPQIAHSVTRTMVEIFRETLVEAGQHDTESAQRFITNELHQYEAKLQEAERRLKDFKQKHIGLMPEDGRSYYARLEGLRDLHRNALLKLKEAEDSASSLRAQLNSFHTPSTNTLVAAGPPDPAIDQLKAKQTELAALQLKLTDKHPNVIAAKKSLEQLMQDMSRNINNPRSVVESNLSSRDYDPAYRGLRLQLSKADARVAALRARVAEHKRRLESMEQDIIAMPKVEEELASLNRNYAVHKEKYYKLAEGLEVAELSDKIDSVKVKVLEWPEVPITPIGPRRLFLSAAVLALAVAFGIGLSLVLGLSNPSIYTPGALEKLTTLPVLGTVSFNASAAKGKLERPFVDVSFFFAVTFLLMFFVALSVIYKLKPNVVLNLAELLILN